MKKEDSELAELENTEDPTQQVGDFYSWIRDYWAEMGRDSDGKYSGMLNFGLWKENTTTMFDAQEYLRRTIIGYLNTLPSGAQGLEIGCGIGGAAIRLTQEHDVILTCMDLVPAQLEIGRKLAQETTLKGQIQFRQGSSMDMPFQNGTFDFSYCIESSFHYQDKMSFYRENYRVLKPGAVAVVADITCENNSLVTFKKGNYFCSVENTRQLMLEAGFTVEKIVSIGDQVFHPLRVYVEKFNHGKRNKLYRYWNLVLKNYEELFDLGSMGYEIFVLRKGDSSL